MPLPSVGLCGVDVRNVNRNVGALAPLELGRPLLEERPRPLLVVLAFERLEREVLQLLSALLRQPEEVRLDRRLGPPHGERRVVGDAAQIVVGDSLEIVDGREALVRQGAASFRLWTGLEPPIEVMRAAIALGLAP